MNREIEEEINQAYEAERLAWLRRRPGPLQTDSSSEPTESQRPGIDRASPWRWRPSAAW
ncbi:MAG: hypothetical protein KBE04_00905 [Phycisphaerae bacterium]|nr:hypothetical protein [Phycisphaerae bacterium]